MKFFWNLDEGQLTAGERSSVAKSAFEFKRRDGVSIEVVFVRNGIVQEMPSTTEIRFALKTKGAYAGGNIAFSADFTEGTDHIWRSNPNLNTTQMDTAFVDGEGEFALIELMGELTMRADADEPWISTQTLTVTIHNDVIRGDEGTPNDADEPTSFLTASQSNARFTRYDAAQSLTTEQKAQVLANLGLTNNRVDVQIFTANGTWTKPTNALRVRRILVGGGGGGGSGANLSTAGGGGGGAPGLVADFEGPASALSATEAVVVGAGGTGGAGVTSGNGNAGTAGGDTSFAGRFGRGGNAGTGGTASGGAGGSGNARFNLAGGIIQASANGADGGTGSTPPSDAAAAQGFMPSPGGPGGGVSGTTRIGGRTGGPGGNADFGLIAGAAGGAAGSTGVPGGAGTAGGTFPTGFGAGGGGGGAGSGNGTANNGGAGGNGGPYGGGGGGGGAANGTSGATSGAGGNGGAGVAIIITTIQA